LCDNEKPPTEVDGRPRTPEAGARYEMTMTREEQANGKHCMNREITSSSGSAQRN
jgi:hypothetical protein